jgi:hypothetical protein
MHSNGIIGENSLLVPIPVMVCSHRNENDRMIFYASKHECYPSEEADRLEPMTRA